MRVTQTPKGNIYQKEFFYEYFYIKVGYSVYKAHQFLIPRGYIFLKEYGDIEIRIYGYWLFWPILKIFFLLKNRFVERGMRIGRFKILFYFPSWNILRRWKLKDKVGEGQVTSGAFFINKSDLIYAFSFPPLMVKWYKKSIINKKHIKLIQ